MNTHHIFYVLTRHKMSISGKQIFAEILLPWLSVLSKPETRQQCWPCINLWLDPNWNTAVHFGTVIKSQISKSSREFKKHLLPEYGDCNIWIIGRFLMAVLPMILTLSFVIHPERALEQRFHHSFAAQGPRLWNIIPAHLHQLTEPATFKSALTKYLLTIPDTPPVVGYVGVNSNSLLDWSINKAVTDLQGWSQQMA